MSEFTMGFQIGLTEDRTKVVINLLEERRPIGHITLEAPELEAFMLELANCRAGLADQVPPMLDLGTRLMAIPGPAWRTEIAGAIPGILLALRHPGFGWIGNFLPPHEARAMGESLVRLSGDEEAPPENPTTPEPG